jgi:hypothetical protein
MLLLNLILLIDVTFSTPTPDNRSYRLHLPRDAKEKPPEIGRHAFIFWEFSRPSVNSKLFARLN